MPILGIDYEKCINCKFCVRECPRRFHIDLKEDKIYFQDPEGSCSRCGHCIAICPENAILHENFGGEVYTFEGVSHLDKVIPYENIYKFFRGHRSVRHYKKENVPEELLRKVFNAMECAPTGSNLRSEKFAILSDQEKIKSLSDAIFKELLSIPSYRSRWKESFEIRKKNYDCPIYFDAPHVIFVYGLGNSVIDFIQMGIIVEYGRLAAQSLGLGTCWNGWTLFAFMNNRKLLKLAGIRGKSWGVFTIGYPDTNFLRCPPRSKKSVKGLE